MAWLNPSWRKGPNVTFILAALTALVLALSVPGSLQHAREQDGFYLFSKAFIEDIPKRLTGPGRFRFGLQPLIAIVLGMRSGLADARAGLPPYLYGVFFHRAARRHLMKSGLMTIMNLLLMGILVDSVCQWLILGISYPGPALIVGPVLVATPYSISRALANRLARLRNGV